MKLQLKKNLLSVLAFVGLIWAVYLINLPLQLSDYNLNQFGLQPRTLHGLIGIFAMPFLHDGLNHLLGNTVPLVVLLMMLTFTRPNPRRIVVCLAVMSGGMLWVVGWDRTQVHVGASGLIYALAVFSWPQATTIGRSYRSSWHYSWLCSMVACFGVYCRWPARMCHGKDTYGARSLGDCLQLKLSDDWGVADSLLLPVRVCQ